MAAALVMYTRGEVATLVRRVLGADPGNGLHCWHAVTQRFRPRSVFEQVSVVNGTIQVAQAHEERERASSRGNAVGVDTS